MKKKTLQRVFAVAMAGTMMAGMLSGCGSSDSSSSTETTTTTDDTDSTSSDDSAEADETSAAESDSDVVAGIDGWEPFADNVTLKVAVYDRGAEGLDPVTDNGYTQYVQENFGDEYNITLEFVPITRSDVMTDYALLAASDDLPTILMEYDYPKVTQWANDGYLQTYSLEDFAQVAPTYYNRMIELNQLSYTEVNDETYFVLAERPYYDTTYTYVTFCRKDWLDEVGIDKVPESYEELTAAYDAIIEAGIAEHPAGGSMLTAASSFDTGSWSFRDYPIDESEWAMHSSLGTAAFSWEPVKEMIKRANAEYNAGYTDPEYSTTDGETAKANFINGKTFSYGGYMASSVDWLESFYAANPDAELAVLTSLSSVEEGVVDFPQMRSDNPYGMTIGFGKDATEDELKAAWMYMEWCTLNIEELQSHTDDWNNFNNSKDFWCITIESAKADTIEEAIEKISPQGLPQDLTQDILDNYNVLKDIADAGHAYTDPAFGVAIDSESEYSATLLSLAIEYYDKCVMCSPEDFEATYEECAQDYLDAGYQEIIDERLEAYEAGHTTKLPE
jgi:putative aldouronate transport system substrate-binding protein